ncbi:flagellar biosynthesis protein FlhF [Oceanobacillus iheyensis]|uniref:Flagellar biosynthesis protein FlhF n=1 Tax=Oceanobacillus iheyensis (strain DSM 14371 / CIP 107618 / JCM 11309 / KCTC 3954 / HTE831) TaxID=221109 RepID=Q8EQW2_OCEIH|nr:flagellar biosynthesis protein FlhF [Oceanobacillus iheyensis]BAC13532.1 flagella-associated protein [Oceanobacillus iheyensis HTE831]
MKIKKYTAPTMPEVMKEVRKDFGTDAVILQSKEVKKGGLLGMFKKTFIEVVAGVDPEPVNSKSIPREKQITEYNQDNHNRKTKDENPLREEILNIQRLIEAQGRQSNHEFTPIYQLAYEHLIAQEISPTIAEQLIKEVRDDETNQDEYHNLESILINVKQLIVNRLEQVDIGFTYDHRIIQFVGPTGVGKTTTIAKIAAKLYLEEKKKVAFITLDTYRIAAVDQLKTYAKILHIPVEVAYSKEDYRKAVEKFSSFDVILVDTAGRNYRDNQYLNEIQEWPSSLKVTNYLVLSMTSKPKDMLDIFQRFQLLGIHGVVFTKLDETEQYGNLLNISWNNKIRIGYMTNGQDVPEDVIQPSAEEISHLILSDNDES